MRPARGHRDRETMRGRIVLPLAVSVVLVLVATLYPPWAIVVATVPIGAGVGAYVAVGYWRDACVRLALAVGLLAVGALATYTASGNYGAISASLPSALASLLFALCSLLPSGDALSLRVVAALATVSSGLATLVALAEGISALLTPLMGTARPAEALTFAALLLGAPLLILVLRLGVPWEGRAAKSADFGAVVALLAGILAVFLFGHIPSHRGIALTCEIAANACAIILLGRSTVLGARLCTKLDWT